MRYRSRSDLLLLSSALLVWFLSDASRIRQTAVDALRLCASSVVPALFPFLTVTGLLTALGFADWAAPILSPLMTPLFRLPGQAGSALVLGFLGGYPTGAATAAELYRTGTLTREEAERLLSFCNNANPAFLISVLGAGVFQSSRVGVWLVMIQAASALLTGLVFRGKDRSPSQPLHTNALPRQPFQNQYESVPEKNPIPSQSFPSLFVEAVGKASMTMPRLCGFVVFFSVLTAPLRAMSGWKAILSAGTLELFSLVPLLPPDAFGFVAAAAFSAWGGLGVLCQTAAVLDGSGLSAQYCFRGKAVQSLWAALVSLPVAVLIF